MEFASVEVKTFLFYPPFVSNRIYVIKTVVCEKNRIPSAISQSAPIVRMQIIFG